MLHGALDARDPLGEPAGLFLHPHPEPADLLVQPTNLFDVVVAGWSFQPEESAFRHEFEVEWLSGLEVGLRFRSANGACIGEPVAVCTGARCKLRP